MKKIFLGVAILVVAIIAFFVFIVLNNETAVTNLVNEKTEESTTESQLADKENKVNVDKKNNKISMGFWINAFLLILSIIALIVSLPFLVKELALKDWFFTASVHEGRAVAIVGAGGGFVKLLSKYQFPLDKITWEVLEPNDGDENELNNKEEEKKGFFAWIKNKSGLSGIYFYGIPGLHKIYMYHFRWNSLRQYAGEGIISAGGGIYYEPREATIGYILLQQEVYYARLESAEDRRVVPLDFDFTIEVKINNSYKALFLVQDWLEYTWSQVLPALRRVAKTYDWTAEFETRMANIKDKKIKVNVADETKNFLTTMFNDEIEGTRCRLRDKYGVTIGHANILRVAPAGELGIKIQEMALADFKAVQDKKAKITTADGEVERIDKVYNKILSLGDAGMNLRRFEALENVASGPGNFILSAAELSQFATSLAKKIPSVIKNSRG